MYNSIAELLACFALANRRASVLTGECSKADFRLERGPYFSKVYSCAILPATANSTVVATALLSTIALLRRVRTI